MGFTTLPTSMHFVNKRVGNHLSFGKWIV